MDSCSPNLAVLCLQFYIWASFLQENSGQEDNQNYCFCSFMIFACSVSCFFHIFFSISSQVKGAKSQNTSIRIHGIYFIDIYTHVHTHIQIFMSINSIEGATLSHVIKLDKRIFSILMAFLFGDYSLSASSTEPWFSGFYLQEKESGWIPRQHLLEWQLESWQFTIFLEDHISWPFPFSFVSYTIITKN